MIELNLEANGIEQEKVKNYLQNNASEILAEKINNGVKINKDNKTLINKKDLKTFFKFASDEARKLVQNNSNYACVDDNTVYGWAIHYFEEDSLEGILYNEDGTEYKPIKPQAKTEKKSTNTNKTTKNVVKTTIKTNEQTSLFDFLDLDNNEENTSKETIEESNEETVEKTKQIESIEKQEENLTIDLETGEILTNNQESTFDDDVTTSLFSIFKNNMEVK